MFWLGKNMKARAQDGQDIAVSPIEFLILVHLRSRELRRNEDIGQYGFELMQELNEIFAGNWEAKSGTIYPILNKMEQTSQRKPALISSELKQSPLGPQKKVYILTPEGRAITDYLVKSMFASDVEFMIQYINELLPIVIALEDRGPADAIFQKLAQFPVDLANLALRRAQYSTDQEVQSHKLQILKSAIDLIKLNVDREIERAPEVSGSN